MEIETLITGIGGQGIQLVAKTLAEAAVSEGREVMVFGSYGGVMRGGRTDATVILGDDTLRSPPTVSAAWCALAMHASYWPPVRACLRPGAVAVLDASALATAGGLRPGRDETVRVISVPAAEVARGLGFEGAGAMVALGALATATAMVGVAALEDAVARVLPPYRKQQAVLNGRAVRAGSELVEPLPSLPWPPLAGAAAAGVAR